MSAESRTWERTFRVVVVAGFALRLFIMAMSLGSNDIFLWNRFAIHIREHGVLEEYVRNEMYNHPPLIGFWALAALQVVGAKAVYYGFVFKLLPFMADVLCAWGCFRFVAARRGATAAWAVAAAFALSPVSLLVSAFHGNTDSVCVAFSLLSAVLLTSRRPLAAGLALGAALNVKLIPLILVPAFIAVASATDRDAPGDADGRRAALVGTARFLVGLGVGLLPFLGVLPVWSAFKHNAIDYNSIPFPWGINWLLRRVFDAPEAVAAYREVGRFLVLALCTAAGLVGRWRGRSAVEVMAAAYAIFLVFAPGFSVQYAIYALPALLLTDLKWGNVYGVLAALFIGSIYFYFYKPGSMPIVSWFDPRPLLGHHIALGLASWTCLALFLGRWFFTAVRPSSTAP